MNADDSLQLFIDLLGDPDADANDRLDACHILGRVYGYVAINALIDTLEDKDFAVRWAASEALCQHGTAAIEPLLRILQTHPADQRLYESAHHILNGCTGSSTRSIIQPVLDALEQSTGSGVSVSMAAFNALGELRQYSP